MDLDNRSLIKARIIVFHTRGKILWHAAINDTLRIVTVIYSFSHIKHIKRKTARDFSKASVTLATSSIA